MSAENLESASQIGSDISRTSSVVARRLEILRQAAELRARAALATESDRLERDELHLRQQRDEVERRIQLRALQEEVQALAGSPDLENPATDAAVPPASATGSVDSEVILNVKAPPFIPAASAPIAVSNADLINTLRLPSAQLMFFNGDPIKFWPFMRSFENAVESCTSDNTARLTRLISYCTDRARSTIECCAVMDPAVGYPRAKALLKSRFGNDYLIAESWIKKICARKPIVSNERDRLQELADDLTCCIETLTAMNYRSELNNQSTLLKIAEQLPFYLQARVKRELCRNRDQGKVPDIGELAQIIREAANEANDPVYGKLATRQDKEPVGKPRPNRQHTSLVTSTTEQPFQPNRLQSLPQSIVEGRAPRPCPMCQDPHTLFGCAQFKALPVEGRTQFAKHNKLCFNCLSAGHNSASCKLTRRCSVPGCAKKHTKFLHEVKQVTGTAPVQSGNAQDSLNGVTSVMASSTGAGIGKNALPILPVIVRNPSTQTELETYALLDSGSTNSFCSADIAEHLNVNGLESMLNLTTLNAEHSIQATVANLEILDIRRTTVLEIPEILIKGRLPISVTNRATLNDITQWRHLSDIVLPEADVSKVGILIGQDCPEAILPLEVRRGEPGSPFAVRTVLGWTVNGPVCKWSNKRRPVSVNFIHSEPALEYQVERLWTLDTVPEPTGMQLSPDEMKTLQIWNDSVQFVNGHYEVSIPFKDCLPHLPDNIVMAKQRLEGLKLKLQRNQQFRDKYATYMSDLIDKQYAEKAADESEVGKVWYLPHHSVKNVNKPDKVRIVFDCSAKFGGVSLNDKVFQGPDLMNKLIGVLLRFRQEPIAFMADIEAMFHQVKVTVSDRNCLRFLWWPEGDLQTDPEVYRMTVHLFGGVWSPSCCSYALRRTAEDNKHKYSEEVTRTVLNNFYVDDCLKSMASEDEAVTLAQNLRSLLKEGGFHLTKWVSNSNTVLSSMPESDRSSCSSATLQGKDILAERALGVRWEISSDKIGFTVINKDKPLTRRGILSEVSSVYDPLGLISPFILPAKRIIQELCRKHVGWDDQLPDSELDAWQAWRQDRHKIQSLKFERCIKSSGNAVSVQLHHFSDASQYAYGVATYVRTVDTNNRKCCRLLMSRSRLAPIKGMTIPRLELSAAAMAVKVDKLVRREFDMSISRSVFWTDSMIVLHYITNSSKRFHTFVANRVASICEISKPEQWKHVDTHSNPADDASRGLSADQLLENDRWLHGPSFLLEEETEWPNNPVIQSTILDSDPEVKGECIIYTSSAATAVEADTDIMTRLFSRYSDWHRLKVSVAWLLRVRQFLLAKAKRQQLPVMMKPLTLSEIQQSELCIVKCVQDKTFGTDTNHAKQNSLPIQSIRQLQNSSKPDSCIRRLEPMLIDGILCVGGRLKCHQMILPNKHPVVTLIIRHYHTISCHSGREHVLSLIRQRYWIIGCRTAVRRTLSSCVTCRRINPKPLNQKMANLPSDRITPGEPPFTYTGVDIFGPFTVKRGRCEVKRYGCLFTCLAVRAIHIEVIHSMDTDSFILALQRFICRRGQVKSIRSDNGTNFVGAVKELKLNQNRVSNFLRQRSIEWQFNPPTASHMGGVWERQIRTVRKVLDGVVSQQTVDDEGLTTLMCIVESVINSRPLTTVSSDINDLNPLTPNHLLLMQSGAAPLLNEPVKQDLYSRKRWRQVQYLADLFWKRWIKEYLPTLQFRQKWLKEERNVQVGDVVLLADVNIPRSTWPLGRVTETFPGNDGLVRSARIQTQTSSVVRPIHKLCLIEPV